MAVFRLRDSNLNHRQANGTTKINDGQWHYIVGVRDGVNDKNYLYVDGVLEKTMDINDAVYSGHFYSDIRLTMGSYDRPHDYYFEGELDEVSIYHRALSYSEILVHYKHCIGEPFTTFLPLSLK